MYLQKLPNSQSTMKYEFFMFSVFLWFMEISIVFLSPYQMLDNIFIIVQYYNVFSSIGI